MHPPPHSSVSVHCKGVRFAQCPSADSVGVTPCRMAVGLNTEFTETQRAVRTAKTTAPSETKLPSRRRESQDAERSLAPVLHPNTRTTRVLRAPVRRLVRIEFFCLASPLCGVRFRRDRLLKANGDKGSVLCLPNCVPSGSKFYHVISSVNIIQQISSQRNLVDTNR
jgi:hypothetical protein